MQHQIMMQQFDALQLSGAMHSLAACKSLAPGTPCLHVNPWRPALSVALHSLAPNALLISRLLKPRAPLWRHAVSVNH